MSNLVPAAISKKNRLLRVLWGIVYISLFRFSPIAFHSWRSFILRIFGADLDAPVYIYPSVKIWAPWNLKMGRHSTLASNVDCYSVDKVIIGESSTVSQYCYLCTASHDYLDPGIMERPQMPLVAAPIEIGNYVWLTSDVFVGPGVRIEDGAVVLARSSVYKDVPPWKVVSGNPAFVKKDRVLRKN